MSDKSNKPGGGAEDLLSKLFEMDEDINPQSSVPNFSEETKVDKAGPAPNARRDPQPPPQPPGQKKSLDDLLKTEAAPQAKSGSAPKELGDDLFDGILEEDPSATEQINIFSNAQAEKLPPTHVGVPPSPPPPPRSDMTEVIAKEAPRPAKQDQTLVLEGPSDSAEPADPMDTVVLKAEQVSSPGGDSADPIDEALSAYSKQEDSSTKDVNTEKFKRPPPSKPAPMPSAPGQVVKVEEFRPPAIESVSAGDFAEPFLSKPVQVSEGGTGMHTWKKKSLKWVGLGLGVIFAVVAAVAGFFRLQSDAGLLGYRIDGLSLVQAYRAPSSEQAKAFEKHFEEALKARQSDEPKQIEDAIAGLKLVLAEDERNLDAAAQILEHSAILTLWYGLKSPWPQHYDEALQNIKAILEKLKNPPTIAAYERAMAWSALALGESQKAYSDLVGGALKLPQIDDETLGVLIELSATIGNKTEAEKWVSKLTKKPSYRVQFYQALLKDDSSAIQELATKGYAPAKIEELIHQTIRKDSAQKLLARSEALLEEVKGYPPLANRLHGFRGDLFLFVGEGAKAREEWKPVVERNPKEGTIWFKLAKSYEEDAQWDDSMAAYKEALKTKGLNEEGILRFARLLRLRGKVLDAVSILDDALKSNPKAALFYYEKGMVQLTIYQDDQAKAAFLKALEIDPNLELATLGLAQLALQRKEWNEAEIMLNKVPKKSAHYSEALVSLSRIARNRYQFGDAEKFLSEAIDENPKLESAYPELVELYLMDEKDGLATTLVTKGLDLMPRSPLLKVSMARIYQFQGNLEKALTELDYVRKNFGHLPEVVYAVADLLIENKQVSQAYDLINPLFEKDSKDPELQYLRAKAFVHDPETGRGVGSNEGAYRSIEMAIRKNGEDVRYRILAAQLSLLLQDKNTAIEHIETVLKFKPKNPQALMLRGDIFRDAGEYEKATEFYSTALKSTRFHAPIYGRLADSFKAQGKAPDAIQYYLKVVQSNPKEARAHLELGKLYSDEGRYLNALRSLSTSIKLDPNVAEAYYFLGFAQKELGSRKDAIKTFEKFLTLSPQGTEANTVRDEIIFLKRPLGTEVEAGVTE